MKAHRALWAHTKGNPDVKIAVLDGPVDTSHPCFAGAALTLVDTLASGPASRGGATAHGTHIASVLFGQPDSEVPGIAPHCSGLLLPVFSDGQEGQPISCSQLDLARAITQAVQLGAHVINISGGEITPAGHASPFLASAVQLCADSNVLIVAAAGNEGCECLHVPAALPLVLAVGAMNKEGSPLDFSNWGEAYQAQGVLAPGTDIVGAVPGGGTVAKTGTSFATPLVSGIVALLLSIQTQQGQPPDPHAIRELILDTVTPCDPTVVDRCSRFLRGKINVPDAIARLTEPLVTLSDANPKHGDLATKPGELTAIPAVRPVAVTPSSSMPLSTPSAERSNIMSETNSELNQQAAAGAQEPSAAPAPVARVEEIPAATETRAEAPPAKDIPPLPAPAVTPSQLEPSAAESGSMVFAMGTLGYDFGTEARRDWFVKSMDFFGPPEDESALTDFIMGAELVDAEGNPATGKRHPEAATSIIWTLTLDGTPIYAIRPEGPFASSTYDKFLGWLAEQREKEEYSRLAVPGFIQGQVTLRSGQIVPVIIPETRGLQIVTESDDTRKELAYRLFYELRNLGLTPQDRAKNSVSAYYYEPFMKIAKGEDSEQEGGDPPAKRAIESVNVARTPVCRPGSDCWDVIITLFTPSNVLQQARQVWRLTIDVSDVVPVAMGKARQWDVY